MKNTIVKWFGCIHDLTAGDIVEFAEDAKKGDHHCRVLHTGDDDRAYSESGYVPVVWTGDPNATDDDLIGAYEVYIAE